MVKQLLHTGWTVRPVGDLSEVPLALRDVAVPARVPGCIHTDLLLAGKIPDPYHDRNEFQARWIGLTDWEYRTNFDGDAKLFGHERIDLVCDGLDTVARIELNGALVAETFNMHRGYRFDVRPHLKRGGNELVVTFASPVRYAERMARELHPRPYCNGPAGPFNFIRKMACNFGWDWGPALPTSGIWKGVRLEGWSVARIECVTPTTVKSKNGMGIEVQVRLERTGSSRSFHISTAIAGWHPRANEMKNPVWATIRGPRVLDAVILTLGEPKFWWPVGHGRQDHYRLHVSLWSDAPSRAEMLDQCDQRLGLRTVELDASPDDIGRKFVLKINGKPIFCKGFNWIPDDCFLDRATEPGRVRQRIQQAVDAGANMLRVWGGGIYETDAFYNICDELGVLVWQDFPFACAMYPEEEPFWSEVEAEARYNVARLAHHPSLAIWNGCNENIWAYRDWGWKDQLTDPATGTQRTWGLNYYLDLLPRICRELTPTVPYWAASPWSGDPDADNGVHPNIDTHGNMHVWKPWFHEDYESYREFQPRFCSEFGFQAPATYASIASIVPPEARDFGKMEMRHSQKSGDQVRDDGDRRNLRHLLRHFNLPGAQALLEALASPNPNAPVPQCGCEPLHPAKWPSPPLQGQGPNFDDLHYLLQVNQARALKLGVEWFRSRQPRCMGTLYWQLNDCWPGAHSWSCIDGDGRPKPLWYATRRFFAGLLATFQPEPDGSLSLVLINDQDSTHNQELLIYREDFSGKCLALHDGEVTVAPRSVVRIPVNREVATPGDPTREFIYANGGDALWFFKPDKELRYDPPSFDASWNGRDLVLRTKYLLRDVCVFVDRLDPQATVSDQLVTTLPSTGARFVIDSKLPLTLEQLTSPTVLRCANPFGSR